MIMLKQILKALYILVLFGIFIYFFGIPNFEKLLEEKTIFAEKKIKVCFIYLRYDVFIMFISNIPDRRNGPTRDIFAGVEHKDKRRRLERRRRLCGA